MAPPAAPDVVVSRLVTEEERIPRERPRDDSGGVLREGAVLSKVAPADIFSFIFTNWRNLSRLGSRDKNAICVSSGIHSGRSALVALFLFYRRRKDEGKTKRAGAISQSVRVIFQSAQSAAR